MQEILRQLRHKGAKSDPVHMCGVHIHIGLNGHTPKSLRNLANIMASHESLLISAMRLDRNRINRYCRTVDPSFLERLNKKAKDNGTACKHLVRRSMGQQKSALQRFKIQNAELPRLPIMLRNIGWRAYTIIPEMHRHSHLYRSFLIGIGRIWFLGDCFMYMTLWKDGIRAGKRQSRQSMKPIVAENISQPI